MDVGFALRTVLALAVIGAMLLAVQYASKFGLRRRLSRPGGGRLVTVVETTYLPNATSLHVVRIGETYAVLARSTGFVAKIADVPPDIVSNWLASQREFPTRLSFGKKPTLRPGA